MPHGLLGLGWGEVVSLGTLIVVIFNLFQTWTKNTAHDSNRKDFDELRHDLTDFKINVSELSQLLRQLNKDLSGLTKRVDKHDEAIDQINVEIARLKERVGDERYEK
ncbi:hypothetical protein [Limosilactobacillus caecicola]|uniref:hypothetical protein n=1 Tax=Limosilactobacillus caecicola TaxID=2941332 RepID=UPI00203B7C82|nr:hypothetical protein [Limosilactobacillus caecicola]